MQHSVEKVELRNGAQGLVIRVPGVDVVQITVEFHAGFDLGDWQKFELPHVMEHMMFTNRAYPNPRDFHREVEKNGAHTNAHTTDTSLEYEYECAAFEAERIARLAGIQISEPTFPAKELKTELGNVAEELSSKMSDPSSSNKYNLSAARLGLPSFQDRIDQLRSLTRADLQKWYDKTHTSGNMRFIVAGDVDFDSLVLPHLEVDLMKGKRLEVPLIASRQLSSPVVEQRDIPQIYYCFQSHLPEKVTYRQMIAARIICSVLDNGFSSTLFGTAREKGLVYGLGTGILRGLYDSDWMLVGIVTPNHADEYFSLVEQEIKKAQNGEISKEQFEATKQLMRGQRALGYQKLNDFVNYYASYFTVGHSEFEEFDRLLDTITLEEAVREFCRFFSAQNHNASFLGNVDEAAAKRYQQTLAPLWRKA